MHHYVIKIVQKRVGSKIAVNFFCCGYIFFANAAASFVRHAIHCNLPAHPCAGVYWTRQMAAK